MKKNLLKVLSLVLVLMMVVCAISPAVQAASGKIDPAIIAETSKTAIKIAEEGSVLLKNEDNVLPLEGKKLNIFGVGSAFPYIGGTGSGCTTSDNPVYLYDALDNAGVEYNTELRKLYEANGGSSDLPYIDHTIINNLINLTMLKNTIDEMDPKKLTDSVMDNAKAFSDTAMVVIGRTGTENSDIDADTLRLSANEKAMIEKVCAAFDNVIVMFNTGNIMEMNWIEDYESIKAVLMVWIPGEFGFEGVVNLLLGKANPSGRLNDTIAYSLNDYPSNENFGDHSYADDSKSKYVEYQEGIYVGYRYFETMAKDKIQFPFGYGLSYTTFSQEITSSSATADKITVSVNVTNTGSVAGKDVVQVYYSAPYNAGGIEKSSVVLGAFDKTSVLQPGASETLTLSFDTNDMASYDYKNLEAYVLEKGDYEIILGKNADEKIDSFTYTVAEDKVIKNDSKTGAEIKNLFDFAYNDHTVLSRSDKDGTYPKSRVLSTTEEIRNADNLPEPTTEGEAPKIGVKYEKTITLQDVANDESLWDAFLDQFTLQEMAMLVADGGYETYGVDRLGVPHTMDDDGPASVKGRNGTLFSDSGTAYPCETCVACTWNTDLAEEMGQGAAKEAANMGTDVWYAPGVNIHRSPLGGRNYEYYSEDPLVSGLMATAVMKGAQENGLVTTIKHFVVNEQETNRYGGSIWVNEQALREIYLRPFEMAVKSTEPVGIMSAYSRIGAYWCGECAPLLKDLLRGEWGYDGFVVSDYASLATAGTYMNPANAVYNGNDIMLTGIWAIDAPYQLTEIYKAYYRDPIGFGTALREATKHACQMKMHTKAFLDPGDFPDPTHYSSWFIPITEWEFESPYVLSLVKYLLSNIINSVCWVLYFVMM